MEQTLSVLILVTLGVFLIPFIAPLLRLPVAVGELLYGIGLLYLSYKGILNIDLSAERYIEFLSFLGFSLLMFLAGLEIDWNKLETLKGREKGVILLVVLTDFIVAALLVRLLHFSPQVVLLLGAMGIGLTLSVLREIELSPYLAQIVLITGSLGEVLTLLGLTIYDLYLSFGLGWDFYLHLLLIALFGLFFLFLLKLLKLLVWYYPKEVAALVVEETKAAVDIRTSLALMLLFMAFSSLVHIEPILGAFIAGTLLGFIFREKGQFEERLAALGYGFLIPFFFVQVGLSFDLSTLSPLFLKLTLLLAVALFAVKLGASLWLKLLGFSFKEVLLAALLFSFPFTVLIAVGKILHAKGVWSSTDFGVVVLLTIVSSILFPFAVKLLAPPRGEE